MSLDKYVSKQSVGTYYNNNNIKAINKFDVIYCWLKKSHTESMKIYVYSFNNSSLDYVIIITLINCTQLLSR